MVSLRVPSVWRRSRVLATLACVSGLMASIWAGATGHVPMALLLALATAVLLPQSLLGRRARRHAATPSAAAGPATKPDWRKAA